MRAPRSVTVPAVSAVLALVGAGCATQVHAHGTIDPAATVSSPPTSTPTDSPTGAPTTTDSPSPTGSPVDTQAERRITCLLITPAVIKAVTDWNNFVDHKSGSKTTVATSLTTNAVTIETVIRSSKIASYDQIRAWGNRLAAEMRTMATALRRGATPGVDRFNGYKKRLQDTCPKG